MTEIIIKNIKDLEDANKRTFFKSFYLTHSIKETMRYFNISETTLYRWVNKLNIQNKQSTQEINWEEVINFYFEHTQKETLEKFNLTREPFERYLKQNNIKKQRTISEKDIAEKYLEIKNIKECAKYFNCSISRIYQVLKKLNIGTKQEIDIDELRGFYLSGHSREETQKQFNISEAQLINFLDTYNIKKDRTDFTYLQENLSKQEIEEYFIIQNHTQEETYTYFADKFNVAKGSIQTLCKKYKINKREYSKQLITELVEQNPNITMHELSNITGLVYTQICHLIAQLKLTDKINFRPQVSNYEKEVAEYLFQLNVEYKTNVRDVLGGGLELDLYIPEKNVGIELNGAYFHSSLFKNKNYHLKKAQLAREKNIRLIQIWDYEWDNKDTKTKIKEMLKNSLSTPERKIYARQCKIKSITNKECKNFLNSYHLQGYRNAQKTYGLFYNDELIEIISFSRTKNARQNGGEWEIIRSCSLPNIVVVGGVSKLIQNFIKTEAVKSIFTYCDFNKFTGRSYEKAGMKFIGYSGPDMKWLLKSGDVINRNTNKNTEDKQQSIAKIFGAGSLKYLYSLD